MKFANEFTQKTFNNILSFYGELIENDIVMSAPEIGQHLGYDAATIRRFINQVKKTTYIYQDEEDRLQSLKLYEEILLHTRLYSSSENYADQQIVKRKRLEKYVKQKTKEYNLKRGNC